MKKLTALLTAIMMFLCLSGCSLFKPELLGTYQAEADLRDLVIKQFDTGTALSDTAYSLEHYLTEFPVTVTFTFTEEKTYSITVDKDSIQASLDGLKTAVAAMLDDYLFDSVKNHYATYGFTVETRADVVELVDMDWEDLCVLVLEVTPEKYVDVIITNAFVDTLGAEYHNEGHFKARNGQLHLSESLDLEPSKEIYETYEINGSTVTFTGGVIPEENRLIDYPYVLTKMSE